jgi:hypothetical protein
MPPVISFNHASLYSNTGLAPSSSSLSVGQAMKITITLLNTGDAGNAIVHLWWIGPSASSTTGPMIDLVNGDKLALPYGPTHPINIAVGIGVGGNAVVSWTPNEADFPRTLGTSVPGCLFAQVEVKPIMPSYPGDTSALTNWSPAYSLCAQHDIKIAT